MNIPRRKVFISHYKGDRQEVDNFIHNFSSVFIVKALGTNSNDDFITSTNTEYVMQRIREKYLQDSTVTIVLFGRCTHSRRYVDWEIKSSLKRGIGLPNGLMGLSLPSTNNSVVLPERFNSNWNDSHTSCYAKFWRYPSSTIELQNWIEDAQQARLTKATLINNSTAMMKYNVKCKICGETH
jgi:hypothetical protein